MARHNITIIKDEGKGGFGSLILIILAVALAKLKLY